MNPWKSSEILLRQYLLKKEGKYKWSSDEMIESDEQINNILKKIIDTIKPNKEDVEIVGSNIVDFGDDYHKWLDWLEFINSKPLPEGYYFY